MKFAEMLLFQQQNGNLFNKTLLVHRTTYLYKSLLREKLFIKHYCFGIRSSYEVEEQSNDFAQIHQGKGWHKRRIIQKALPHRGWNPHIIWVPKIHKVRMPLRPIVSSIGTVTYQTAKEVARMLKHLVVKSPHVRNTQDFIHRIKGIHLNQD